MPSFGVSKESKFQQMMSQQDVGLQNMEASLSVEAQSFTPNTNGNVNSCFTLLHVYKELKENLFISYF